MRHLGALTIFAVSASLLSSLPTLASEPPWPTAPYNYVVVDQDLRSVLQQFASNTGLHVVMSDKVQGRVHGPLPVVPPKQFFNDLAQQFGLDWTYDGSIISVSAASEAQTEVIPLGGVPFDKLRRGLASSGLLDPRFELRAAPGGDVALLSGPPRYLAEVKEYLAALAAEKPPVAPVAGPPAHKAMTLMKGAASSRVEFP